MPRNLPGPEHETVEFKRSEAYADFVNALRGVGVRSYPALIQQPPEVQRAFHEDWSARMRARVEGGAIPRAVPVLARERRVQVRRLWGDGLRDWEIASRLGVSEQRVSQIRNALKLPRLGRRHRRGEIAALATEGLSDHDIAARLGMHPVHVGQTRRALGIRRRAPRGSISAAPPSHRAA